MFIVAVIFLTILVFNSLFGENFMIELWNISAILVPISFAAWVTIHSIYGEKVVEKKKARLKKAYERVKKSQRWRKKTILNRKWLLLMT